MKYIHVIINLLLYIPKLIDFIKEYTRQRELKKIKDLKEKQEQAFRDMQAAKTKDEVKDANKKITSNLS
jgi:hypothetical protein